MPATQSRLADGAGSGIMMMVRLFRFRGTELQPDLFAKERDKERMLSFQRLEVALMRQRHKEESQKGEQAE